MTTTQFLAGWIIFQLLVIGVAGGSIEADVLNRTYDCAKDAAEWRSSAANTIGLVMVGALVPLVAFTEDMTAKYCEEQKISKEPK